MEEKKSLSLQSLAGLEDVIAFLRAFYIAFRECGCEYMQERDAERVEKNIDDCLIAAAFLQKLKEEHLMKAAGRGEDAHGFIREVCAKFSKILSGNSAKSLVVCLEKFLERELSGKLSFGSKPVSTLLALKSVDKLVGVFTMACKNAPKAPLTQKLVFEGIIEEKRDRSPEFPSVDTGWVQKHETILDLISFYEGELSKGKKEERG